MRLCAAVDRFPGELGEIEVFWGERLLFRGRVDVQDAILNSTGHTLALDARSGGAALLDNEAAPCTLTGADLATVFRLFAAPYGFVLECPRAHRRQHTYTVGGGISEWEALAGFARIACGVTPHVDGNRVIADRPRGGEPLVVGGGGLAFCELREIHAPWQVLSKVVLRDGDGRYSSAVHNSAAGYYGAVRKRYMRPSGELASPALDANARVRRSMLAGAEVRAVLPGLADAQPGQEARIADPALHLGGLLVREVAWRVDARGATTELGLVRAEYWD